MSFLFTANSESWPQSSLDIKIDQWPYRHDNDQWNKRIQPSHNRIIKPTVLRTIQFDACERDQQDQPCQQFVMQTVSPGKKQKTAQNKTL